MSQALIHCRKITLLVILILRSMCYAQHPSPLDSSITYDFNFRNGEKIQMTFEELNPHAHKTNLFTFTCFDFRASSRSALGPFVLEPIYSWFSPNRKVILNSKLLFAPIDIKIMEGADGETNFWRNEIEIWSNFVFFQKVKHIQKKIPFTTGEMINFNQVYYLVNGSWPVVNQFTIRSGLLYRQGTVGFGHRGPVITEENGLQTQENVQFDGYRQITLFAGISRVKKLAINTQSKKFGYRKDYAIGEIYADFLYAPVNRIYGNYKKYSIDQSGDKLDLIESTTTLNKKNVPLFSNSGVRIGAISRSSLSARLKLGLYVSTEISVYPGYRKCSFEWTFLRMGLTL